jgi:dipeptidyl aminopeptidase/acylaminoacyl peptidase
VAPNGSDDKLEFTAGDFFSPAYAWSPDGRSIVYPKQVGSGRIELFVRELESGTERQLTTLGKGIGGVTWTRSDRIIFSANVSGNDNLWMVSASGGSPVQLTRGSGPDASPSASKDLSRLLFTQAQTTGTIWIGAPGSNDARQLTTTEASISAPAFAPDNRRIAYVKQTPSSGGDVYELLLMDIATGERNQVLSERSAIHSPKWSPDGRWIAFGMHPDTVPHDESKAWIIDPDAQAPPRPVGAGIPSMWIDNRSFLTTRLNGTWICTVDSSPVQRYFRDSVYAWPVLGGTYIVYGNVIASRKPGTWIEPAPGRPKAAPRELIKSLVSGDYDDANDLMYYMTSQNEFRRIKLPGGESEIVPGAFPNMRVDTEIDVSPDGKRVMWLVSRQSTKLVLIDNFIK